jgi:outer membrane lipopolysaccharide assembly protein LptE/RlpB
MAAFPLPQFATILAVRQAIQSGQFSQRGITLLLAAMLVAMTMDLAGCGYHPVGSGTHMPEGIHTVAVPMFENHTQLPRIELWMTQAVLHDLASRTQLRLEPKADAAADATLKGIILAETVTPLTYTSNATTTTTSSYTVTVIAKVLLTDSHQHVLYENDNYTFREVYESTQQLSSFIQEDSPALQRLSKQFASAVVSDMLESF